jgi:hypothetical protein
MDETMWAIFTKDFNFDRRPKQAIAFAVKASEQPQNWPRDVVSAAVSAGAAREVESPGNPRLRAEAPAEKPAGKTSKRKT